MVSRQIKWFIDNSPQVIEPKSNRDTNIEKNDSSVNILKKLAHFLNLGSEPPQLMMELSFNYFTLFSLSIFVSTLSFSIFSLSQILRNLEVLYFRAFTIHTRIVWLGIIYAWAFSGTGSYLQRKSMTSRPSESRPADVPKKARPLGGFTGNPSPATRPPVSELESPKLKMTGTVLHWERTGRGSSCRERKMQKKAARGRAKGEEERRRWVESEAISVCPVGGSFCFAVRKERAFCFFYFGKEGTGFYALDGVHASTRMVLS